MKIMDESVTERLLEQAVRCHCSTRRGMRISASRSWKNIVQIVLEEEQEVVEKQTGVRVTWRVFAVIMLLSFGLPVVLSALVWWMARSLP